VRENQNLCYLGGILEKLKDNKSTVVGTSKVHCRWLRHKVLIGRIVLECLDEARLVV
jgi:hypothetical protein